MAVSVQVARMPHGGFPECQSFPVKSDQTFGLGIPVTYDSVNKYITVHGLGATVTNLLGFSLEGCSTTGVSDNPDGKINVALATRSNVFMAKATDGSGVVQTAALTMVGVQYELLITGSGYTAWCSVNTAATTNKLVEVIAIDTELNVVFFKVIESAVQII